jgi:hypothetical protein
MSKQLIVPNAFCWSSQLDAVKRIVEVWDKIQQVCCSELNLPKLKAIELEFLELYAKSTEPVTRTLNLLQRDNNCFLGTLLPTLSALRKKIIDRKQN